MEQLVTAIFGTVHKRPHSREDDVIVATIECELLSPKQMSRKGIVEIAHRPGESGPEVVPEDSWKPFISLVDFSHTAITHYYQALQAPDNHVVSPRTRLTMNVEIAVDDCDNT